MSTMKIRRAVLPILVAGLGACEAQGPGRLGTRIEAVQGDGQAGRAGSQLADPLRVMVRDNQGDPFPNEEVTWSVLEGGGQVSPVSATTGSDGIASADFLLGPTIGQQRAQAEASGLSGSPVIFTATATEEPGDAGLSVLGGGNNVAERYSSDLWIHGSYAYTGTWGGISRGGRVGNVLKVWSLNAAGAPTLVDSITISGINTVSDVEVSPDGQLLMFGAENGPNAGLYLYSLANPARPTPLAHIPMLDGIHTATLSEIGGRLYAFAAKNPFNPALEIFDVTNPVDPPLVATVGVPDNYGIHDTFVRDGLAFVFAWDTGVIIYDVGNGVRGGSPVQPVEVSRIVTGIADAGSPASHNGWWFHNPVTSERRYLFVGQEGPAVIGTRASGDIHVVDVSDLANPREVAFFHLNGAGTHNFWMDEERQILYAAYYNGGVVALDVSGTLAGDLSGRLLGQVKPGGEGNTFTWGVQLANGFVYAIDMVSGLWQLTTE